MAELARSSTHTGVSPMSPPVQKESKSLRGARGLLGGLWWAAWGLAACGGQGETRHEARELITSLNAVSDEGSLSQRSAAIARLDRLSLHTPEHVQTRKVCREAHQGLLEAETAQAEARRTLAAASGVQPQAALEHAQADAIASDIERSNRALATAKLRFPECERAMRSLLKEAH
jgi:uncharacterized protein YyaL (SSP411 family)